MVPLLQSLRMGCDRVSLSGPPMAVLLHLEGGDTHSLPFPLPPSPGMAPPDGSGGSRDSGPQAGLEGLCWWRAILLHWSHSPEGELIEGPRAHTPAPWASTLVGSVVLAGVPCHANCHPHNMAR